MMLISVQATVLVKCLIVCFCSIRLGHFNERVRVLNDLITHALRQSPKDPSHVFIL